MARGTIFLMVAQTIFLVGGYIIHFGLARMISVSAYGVFGVVISILNIMRIFLQNGVTQSVTKFVSEGRDINIVKKESMKIQIIFILLTFTVYFFSAPYLARILGDSDLTYYLRLSSLILPISAITIVYMGLINGVRQFKNYAFAEIFYNILRVMFVFGFVFCMCI